MSLPDFLPIRPFTRPARGEVTLPGSKSITNRALLLAALCDGPVKLTGALFSEDTEIMAEALNRLGIAVKSDPVAKTFHVVGQGGNIPAPSADLFVGNAGTAARFLTALCAAAKSGTYHIDGVPQMRKRPMKGLLEALEQQGAEIIYEGEKHCFPFTIKAHGLRGGEIRIDASESSQMLSGLLMVAPLARQSVRALFNLDIRWPFVGMTCELMLNFGRAAMKIPTNPAEALEVPTGTYHLGSDSYTIEPDATAASYFIALPLTTRGKITLPNLKLKSGLQGDTQFIQVIKHVGLTGISETPEGLVIETGLRSTGLGPDENFNEFSDTFLTLAAIAPILHGTTRIRGIGHSRKQETDRVAGMAHELKKLGQGVLEEHDALTITPDLAALRRAADAAPGGIIEIETYHDHRFAMSFGILGCYNLRGDGSRWIAIRNPACCAKTFPNFFEVLEKVRITSHPDEPAHPSSPP